MQHVVLIVTAIAEAKVNGLVQCLAMIPSAVERHLLSSRQGLSDLQCQMIRQVYADHGHSILAAFGILDRDITQMHLSVPILTYRRNLPRPQPKDRRLIEVWMQDHYITPSEAGKRTMLKRIGSSSMVEESRAASAAEFFLFASLDKGREYTLDFVPIVRETKRYRYEFTAPHEPNEVFSRVFVPVEGE